MGEAALFNRLNVMAAAIWLPKGSVLFRSGDLSEGVYLVREGRVGLNWPIEGNLYQMETVGPGTIISLPDVLSGTYTATARTIVESSLGFVASVTINHLLDCYPDFTRAAMEHVAGQVRRIGFTRVSARISSEIKSGA